MDLVICIVSIDIYIKLMIIAYLDSIELISHSSITYSIARSIGSMPIDTAPITIVTITIAIWWSSKVV